MDNLFQNNLGEKSEHPPREMLLLFVDGELPAKEAAQLETHLEACWPCRVKTKKIQEAIADIIEFDEQVLTPRIVPPQAWRNFDRRLNQLVAASGKQTVFARLMGSVGRFLPAARFISARRAGADSGSVAHPSGRAHVPSPVRDEIFIEPQRPSFSSSPVRGDMSLLTELRNVWGRWSINMTLLRSWFFATPLRVTVTVFVVALIAVMAFLLKREPVVSASELLRKSTEAQAARLHATAQPVIHQRLQLRRKTQANEETVSWETWDDTVNARFVQSCEGCASTSVAKAAVVVPNTQPPTPNIPDLLTDLTQVLEANHMDPARPLSAVSYQSWHNTLQHQRDEVTKSKLADGSEALTLRTISASPVSMGQIAEATFVVRTKNWQPTELRLDVATEGGSRIYDLTETTSEIMSLAQVSPGVFAEQPVVAPSPASSPKEIARKETQPTPTLASNSQPLNPAPAATAELEIEALRLLSQAGADLGEQISVKRTSAGMLEITGIVETDKRKTEIINALGPIASNPSVRIDIQTVAEAVAKQTSNKPTPAPSTRAVEITSNRLAAEAELRAYFVGKGKDTDDAIRQYAARMVSLSGRAMDHLWAMKRLLNHFSPEEARALTPEARNEWIGLIRSHARSYQQTTESLRGELHPVFFAGQPLGTAPEGAAITDTSELTRTVNQLFELGSSNDRVIRSAFTSSSGGVMTTVIKTPQFWRSLSNAEGLAARIGAAVRP